MDDLPTDLDARARERAEALIAELRLHLADDRRGERLRSGVTIAILGAPNAGKSALFNALLGRDAAIVSARPGTTRDVLEGRLVLGGVVATLCDTAGVRAAEDEIEAEGVRRTLARAEEADLVLAVVASDAAPDRALLARLEEAKPPALVVASKADLGPPADAVRRFSPVPVSALTGAGLSALRDALAARLRSLAEAGEAGGLTRPRHRAAVVDAAAGLEEAIAARLPEVAAEGYRAAALAFGRLTGAVAVEAVLDRIFADFCIGK
jgi:tRNA modification GTPase